MKYRPIMLLSLMLAVLGCPLPVRGIEFKEVISGKKIPFVLQLKDLGDDWRRLSAGNAGESGSWMQAFSAMTGQANSTYYTRGETLPVGQELLLVGYRAKIKGAGFGEIMAGKTPTTEVLSPETPLTLCLLNLSALGSIEDIRPFNLEQELEESKKQAEALAELRPGFPPAESATKEPASSLGNLKQLALALLMFADDHDEVLPAMEDIKAFREALSPYLKDRSIFLDSATGEPYGFNAWLSGKKVSVVEQPEATVVFYESKPNPENQLRAVAFLDGHTQFVDEARWQELKNLSHLP